ncbi:Acyl dehydratase [Natronorubrum sediminis]|uniref:Acyl dehydratase n=1 Tax=Natronorubrum sediminis TaxID=640943 RepID=A0A1H6FRP6_9EURY|nr:MaoC family dehydratase [Natronorubrum sediminis]SEH13576.1 Acyl dehydratase [Natronorubrum sediminis]
MTRHYEDLQVGDVFEVGSCEVTKLDIISFAEQFDPQPFHVDEEEATDSMFGELVASGLHTLCLSVRLFVTEFVQSEEGLANMGGLGMDKLEWHKPVYPGNTLNLRIEVLEKTPSSSRSDRGYVMFGREVCNEHGEAVMTNVSNNVVRRATAE